VSTSPAKTNPFVSQVRAAAIEAEAAGRLEATALDTLLLADAAVRRLRRECAEASECHMANGSILYVSQKTGKPIPPERTERAERALAEAEEDYRHASGAAVRARGKLGNCQRAAADWERLGQLERERAEEEAALTPEERAARGRRERAQRDMAAR
jgi:hypothetical protein